MPVASLRWRRINTNSYKLSPAILGIAKTMKVLWERIEFKDAQQ